MKVYLKIPFKTMVMFILVSSMVLAELPKIWACTRVLWSNNGTAVVVGRNMDWASPMPVDLWTLPRGIERNGLTGENTLRWSAKYGSVVAAGPAASDGVNEKGFAGHLLWLAESDYGKRDPHIPGLAVSLWLQYYLDNFSTVKEAVHFTRNTPFQLVTGVFDGRDAVVHLTIEDRSGDSAVIEYTDGKPTIYHSRADTVVTNSPPYHQQLQNLKNYQGLGGNVPLPGTSKAADRFVRAAYYLEHLPKPADQREAIASILSIMRNAAQPYGVSAPNEPNTAPTRWRTVIDLTHLVYYYESSQAPNMVWVKLKELNFAKGTPVKKLDLITMPDRVGDVSKDFKPATPFKPIEPVVAAAP